MIRIWPFLHVPDSKIKMTLNTYCTVAVNSKWIRKFHFNFSKYNFFNIQPIYFLLKITNSYSKFGIYVICMSSGDLLIWRNLKFWSTNIYIYIFFSTEKINLLLVQQKNVDQSNSLFLSWKWTITNISTSKFEISSN